MTDLKANWRPGEKYTADAANAIAAKVNAHETTLTGDGIADAVDDYLTAHPPAVSVVADTTPDLGGDLNLNGHTVGAATAADLTKLHDVTRTAAELNALDPAPVIHAATAKTTPVSDDEFPMADSAASYVLKHIKYSDLLAAIAASVTAGADPDDLTSGESTLSRRAIMNGATLTSGIVRLTYFTAKKTETINSVRVGTYTTAAGATPTLCRIGIYSVDGSGNLTLVASTANDTALFAAASTTYTKALSASWSKTAGQRYAVGVLVVTAATAPTIQGQILSLGDELGQAPRLAGARAGQSDLPSSITAGNVVDTTHQCYVAMVP